MKAIHFGAGNIGRGFIGELLHDSGYDLCFVEVDQKLVDLINKNNSYTMYIIDEDYKKRTIDRVIAYSPINDEEKIIDAIVNADLITTSVCVDNFSKISKLLAKGLATRLKANKEKVDILACENAFYASNILREVLSEYISRDDLDEISSFSNVAVDRIALARIENGIKIPEIQKTYELIIEKNNLVDTETKIYGAEYVDDLDMYLERKLYVFNCGHAATAYLGYHKGYKTIHESMMDKEVFDIVKNIMWEAANALMKKYIFSKEDMKKYIDKILERISLEALHDEVIRVGRSPIRKLSKKDRLVGPTELALKYNLPVENLLKAIAMGYVFNEKTDEQAQEIQMYINENGIEAAINKYSEIDDKEVTNKIISLYKNI